MKVVLWFYKNIYQLMKFLEYSSMLGMQLKLVRGREMHEFLELGIVIYDFLGTG